MADALDRDGKENRLARRAARLLRSQYGTVLDLFGDEPGMQKLPAQFWQDAAGEMNAALAPEFEGIFIDQAGHLMEGLPIGVDWALVNQGAVDWAQTYTFDLVRGINRTSRNALQRSVSAYFDQGLTIGDLQQRIGRIYSPVRAEAIAITEVTRASVQGEMAIAGELSRQGVDMIAIFETSDDEIVCPICAPLDGKKRGDGWTDPPPLHVRCRCWVNHVLPSV